LENNVGGTHKLFQTKLAQPEPPRLIFGSSLHVFGQIQEQFPSAGFSIQPLEYYVRHKVESEKIGVHITPGLEHP
jgi:UDP-glucose 4-epimerase